MRYILYQSYSFLYEFDQKRYYERFNISFDAPAEPDKKGSEESYSKEFGIYEEKIQAWKALLSFCKSDDKDEDFEKELLERYNEKVALTYAIQVHGP